MYEIFVNGIYKGTYSLEEVIIFLVNTSFFTKKTGYFETYSSEEKVRNQLEQWAIGRAMYLDINHRFRIIKVG